MCVTTHTVWLLKRTRTIHVRYSLILRPYATAYFYTSMLDLLTLGRHGSISYWFISVAGPHSTLAAAAAVYRRDRQTDGRTLDRFMTLTAYYADGVRTRRVRTDYEMIEQCCRYNRPIASCHACLSLDTPDMTYCGITAGTYVTRRAEKIGRGQVAELRATTTYGVPTIRTPPLICQRNDSYVQRREGWRRWVWQAQ